ncbi:hypothetical protein ACVMDO_002635 [Bradyrhizobium sp. USDA 4513]
MFSFLINIHSIACGKRRGSRTMAGAGMLRPIVAILVLAGTAVSVRAQEINDYPTSARAEYVFGCMKANGESRQSIEQCSCSIDVVASIIPYDRYVTAETVLSMAQVRGNLGRPVPLVRAGRERAQRPQARPGRSRSQVLLEHDPKKCEAVFRKDHA